MCTHKLPKNKLTEQQNKIYQKRKKAKKKKRWKKNKIEKIKRTNNCRKKKKDISNRFLLYKTLKKYDSFNGTENLSSIHQKSKKNRKKGRAKKKMERKKKNK